MVAAFSTLDLSTRFLVGAGPFGAMVRSSSSAPGDASTAATAASVPSSFIRESSTFFAIGKRFPSNVAISRVFVHLCA